MKTTFFFFAMLANVAASAQTLSIKIATINYSTKIATCDLSWTGRNATHLSDVWVFVDYIEISGNTTTGSWNPTAITGATVTQKTTGNATASTVSGNTRGVWIKSVTSGANFTGQIALQLSGVPAKFNACAFATDYPPNATINNGTYTLKGTSPFTINTSITESGKTYFGGCITSLTDKTGCPGIINHSFSAGAINSSSTFVRTGVIPAAITSNTNASSGGGFTYRWVRTGTPNATYTDNSAGHSFSAAEVSSAGTWTYYREVRDNTCNTSTWSRSSGSYVLTVIACPYTGSDLYLTASYLCQQRTSGALNWQAYIRDTRDSEIYRIVLMPDNKWWLAQSVKYAGTGVQPSYCGKDECGRLYTHAEARGAWGGTSGTGANKQGVCPSGWVIPMNSNLQSLFTSISSTTSVVCQRLQALDCQCSGGNDYYGWAAKKISSTNGGTSASSWERLKTNDGNLCEIVLNDRQNYTAFDCGYMYTDCAYDERDKLVRCYRP